MTRFNSRRGRSRAAESAYLAIARHSRRASSLIGSSVFAAALSASACEPVRNSAFVHVPPPETLTNSPRNAVLVPVELDTTPLGVRRSGPPGQQAAAQIAA